MTDREFVQTVSAQIPWSHNIAILENVKDPQRQKHNNHFLQLVDIFADGVIYYVID